MLILASSSPRRRELLEKYGYKFEIKKADIDETMDSNLSPFENVLNVSFKKAKKIYEDNKNDVILACDTIVVYDGKIYGKPKDEKDAYNMLKLFSGKTHEVISGVCILAPGKKYNFYETSYVKFKELSDEDIKSYIETKEPFDKAGSYAIQGIGKKLVERFSGDLNNIIGLPIDKVDEVLKGLL